MIKSTNYDQQQIINDILELHAPRGIDLDPTYSKGNFYKNSEIKPPQFKYDINPQVPGVEKYSADALPLTDESVHCWKINCPCFTSNICISRGINYY